MTEWAISARPVAYPEAVSAMEARVAAILRGEADELVWLLEHPPVYTSGASASPVDLLQPDRFPVYAASRGGQFTYHGPGQRIAYVMLDLTRDGPGRGRDVRAFVCNLEAWLIDALAELNLKGERRPGRVGVWIDRARPEDKRAEIVREDKIAAVGVRLKRWVSFHGISFNVDPDLEHFSGIVPCGASDPRYGVTSLEDLGRLIPMHDVDVVLKRTFIQRFGEVVSAQPPL